MNDFNWFYEIDKRSVDTSITLLIINDSINFQIVVYKLACIWTMLNLKFDCDKPCTRGDRVRQRNQRKRKREKVTRFGVENECGREKDRDKLF